MPFPTKLPSAERMIFLSVSHHRLDNCQIFQVMCPCSFDAAIGAKCEKKTRSGNERNLVSFGLVQFP